jgi:GNAT superfamily N-acetyltransferase
MSFRIREYHPADIDAVLELWEQAKLAGFEPVYGLAEVLASCEKDHAVVAVDGNRVVGAAVGRAAHEQGWIVFFSTLDQFRRQGIGSSLLAALEAGSLRGAALDVFEGEPQLDPRFTTLSNALLQPHHASGTFETRRAMGQLMRDNLTAHFAGKPLLTPVI